MAESVTYRVGINPMTSTVSSTALDGGSDTEVILTPTNLDAIRKLISDIKAGKDVSSVVTAINAIV